VTSSASFSGVIARLNVATQDGRVLEFDDDPRHFPTMPVPVIAVDLRSDGTNEIVGRVEGVTVRQEVYGAELHGRGWLDLSELFRMFPDYEDSLLPKGMGPNPPEIPLIGCGVAVVGGEIKGGHDRPERLFTIGGTWTLQSLQVYGAGSPVVWPGVGLRLEEITMDGEL
jgi:hypothetical protein